MGNFCFSFPWTVKHLTAKAEGWGNAEIEPHRQSCPQLLGGTRAQPGTAPCTFGMLCPQHHVWAFSRQTSHSQTQSFCPKIPIWGFGQLSVGPPDKSGKKQLLQHQNQGFSGSHFKYLSLSFCALKQHTVYPEKHHSLILIAMHSPPFTHHLQLKN